MGAKYRDHLPQLDGGFFLTDGGLETEMVFKHGLDLPEFAAFPLLEKPETRAILNDYFRDFARIAVDSGAGFILESCTYKASSNWGNKLGYDDVGLRQANHDAIQLLKEIRDEMETSTTPMVISGCIGPATDAYGPGTDMSAADSYIYHAKQIGWLKEAGVDMVSLFTLTSSDEAIGFVRAANDAAMPCVISFTLETDGKLPNGETLEHAITRTDAETAGGPAYYMVNCAHPTHFAGHLAGEGDWKARIMAIRANASSKSHEELEQSTELDEGHPNELAAQSANLKAQLPHLHILGGCCGTGPKHIHEMAHAWK